MEKQTTYFIHVIGPYDSTFVGPFRFLWEAAEYLRSIDRTVFSAYVLTDNQLQDNIREFGWVEVEQPEGRVQ